MYVWRNPFYRCVSNGKWEVIIPLICHSDMEPCLGHCCCLIAYFAPPVVCFKAAILVQASLDTTTGPILFSWLLQGMSAVHPYFTHNRVSILKQGGDKMQPPEGGCWREGGCILSLVCWACSYKTAALEGYSEMDSEEFFPCFPFVDRVVLKGWSFNSSSVVYILLAAKQIGLAEPQKLKPLK